MPEITDALAGLNLSDAMEKLMAHPEMIQLAASVLRPNGGTPKAADTADTDDGEKGAEAVPAIATGGSRTEERGRSRRGGSLEGSVALLIALKPYLSEKRCETVDRLIEVGKIGRVISELL